MRTHILTFLALSCPLFLLAQDLDIAGKAKIGMMDKVNTADSVVVRLADSTLAMRDVSSLSELQNLTSVLGQGNSAGNTKITSLADPSAAQDAATKNYVDTVNTTGWTMVDDTSYTLKYVGIGTSSPEQKLHILGDSKMVGKLDIINSVGDSSVFIGANAGINDGGNNQNTFVGVNAGKSNLSGDHNIFLGKNAGYNNKSGDNGVFLGSWAGFDNTTGYNNTFLGFWAGRENTVGRNNTFLGASSGSKNTYGGYNTTVGKSAGYYNTSGDYNTFLGALSGFGNTSGDKNTLIGRDAGYYNQTGSHNTFLGYDAGNPFGVDSLDRAIAIGYKTRVSCHQCGAVGGVGTEAVKLGIGTSNPQRRLHLITNPSAPQVRMEDNRGYFEFWAGDDFHIQDEGGNKLFIKGSGSTDGNIGMGTTNPQRKLHLLTNPSAPQLRMGDSQGYFELWAGGDFVIHEEGVAISRISIKGSGAYNGNVGISDDSPMCKLDVAGTVCSNGTTLTSDRRFKKDIEPLKDVIQKLLKVEGVSYLFRQSEFPDHNFRGGRHLGVVAQDLEKIFPELVITFKDGYKTVNYNGLIPLLIEGFKEQQTTIQRQQMRPYV